MSLFPGTSVRILLGVLESSVASSRGSMQFSEQTTRVSDILKWSAAARCRFNDELQALFRIAFPNMAEDTLKDWVGDHFVDPGGGGIARTVLSFRNERGGLIATMLFDGGAIAKDERIVSAIYVLSRAVSSEYQGSGLVYVMMRRVLLDWRPDYLLTTCAHSASLHSWLRVAVTDPDCYEVYPRWRSMEGKEVLESVPQKELDLVLYLFERLYSGVVRGNRRLVDVALANMTKTMVRKNIYEDMYDFDPWSKGGREDKVAKALNVSAADGILLVMRKAR